MGILKSRVAAVVAGSLVVVGAGAGGAVARDFVTSAEIQNQTIGSEDIGRNAVRGWELAADSTHGGHIMRESIGSEDLSPWVQSRITRSAQDGRDGADGADGTNGTDGEDGVSGLETDGTYETLLAGDGTSVETFTLNCAAGKYALGGGFSVDFPQHRANVRIVGSQPSGLVPMKDDPQMLNGALATAWEIHVVNDGPETSIRPWVTCAELGEDETDEETETR